MKKPMRHRPRRCAGETPMDQVRGGGGCGFSDQSGGGSGSLSRSCTVPKQGSGPNSRSMARSWRHLARQNSGGQALSAAQHGQSSVLDAPFFIEAQSSMGAAAAAPPRSPASPCAKVTCSPANFATAAQADTTGTSTIATATSPEIIVRSRGKRGNPPAVKIDVRPRVVNANYRVRQGTNPLSRESVETIGRA